MDLPIVYSLLLLDNSLLARMLKFGPAFLQRDLI